MAPTARQPLGDAAFDQLLSVARLELPAERRAAAGPVVDMVMSLFDSLDEIEVGETPPATAFDARWE
jgi:hypothetical protein